MRHIKGGGLLLASGLVFSFIWISGLTYWAYMAVPDENTCQISDSIENFRALFCLSLNEFGDFLAGGFAVLAFFWLALAVLLQREELIAQRAELEQTRKALEAQAEESKRSANYLDQQARILKEQYELNSAVRNQDEAERIANLAIENLKFGFALVLHNAKFVLVNEEEKFVRKFPITSASGFSGDLLVDALMGHVNVKRVLDDLNQAIQSFPSSALMISFGLDYSPFDMRSRVEILYDYLHASRASFFADFEKTHGARYLKEAVNRLLEIRLFDDEYYLNDGYRIESD